MVSKYGTIKTLTDVLDYASTRLARNLDESKHVDTSAYDDYIRVSCRFSDGFGISVLLDWYDEDGD